MSVTALYVIFLRYCITPQRYGEKLSLFIVIALGLWKSSLLHIVIAMGSVEKLSLFIVIALRI
jgi:hypothetical protein